MIIRYDLQGRVDYISAAARRYGGDPEKLVGRDIADLLDPSERERNAQFFDDLAAGRSLPEGDQNIWRSREGFYFEGTRVAVTNDDGKVVGAMVVLHDVTRRVNLEAELRAKQAEAESAARAKSEFLANMSHELRTPLTAIVGFCELLAKTADLTPKARRYVELIEAAGDSMVAMVDDILTLGRLEEGRVTLSDGPFNPAVEVAETVEMVALQARHKHLALELNTCDQLPELLSADGSRVRQILLNLLANAVKFTEEGRVTVTASHDGERLRISVADTGIGIPTESADRIFQRFSQVDASSTRRHGGAGLGLAICKGLVDLMGGEIGVESTHGKGSTFWFAVPALAVVPSQADPRAAAPETVTGGGARVLVADDDARNRELIGLLLEDAGYRVSFAENGEGAVRQAQRTPFDLILMDMQMPGVDGLTASRLILREPGPNKETPILAITANVLPEQAEACRQAGMRDHIAKPIDSAALLTKVAYWIDQSSAPQPHWPDGRSGGSA